MRSEKSNASLGDEHARSPSLSALATTNHEHDHAMATRCEAVRAAGKFQMDLRAHQGGARAERVSGARGDERRFAKGVGAWLRCMRKRRRATRVSPEELNQYRECPYHALGLE